MNNVPKKSWSLATIKRKIIKKFYDNNSILDESARINIRRIFYLSIIAIPLRIIDICLFSFKENYDTLVLKTWSQGIIISHFILLILMVGFFLTTLKLKNRTESNTAMFVLQYIVVVVIMASGIAIVTFDQLVTTNITPFILVCIISGAIFLIRPLISFVMYVTSYVAYYYSISLTITEQQVLLSNRVNGITAIGIGFLLSIIIWHYNYINITQKRRIEIQQKQLEQLAYYDSLTGLPNRRFLENLIKREFSLMKRHGYETVIINSSPPNLDTVSDSLTLFLKRSANCLSTLSPTR